MSYWDKFEKADNYWSRFDKNKPALRPLTESQKAEALNLARQIRPKTDNTFGDYLAQNVADMAYGADRALSGATFGGYDWLKRKTGLGVNQDEYKAMKRYNDGSDMPATAAGVVAEIGGNILGAGGALAKGLSKAGLKGLKLASAAGGLEGAAYGVTGSDTLGDLPKNIALRGSLGAGMGAGMSYLMPYLLSPINAATRPVINRVSRYFGKRKNPLSLPEKTITPKSNADILAEEGLKKIKVYRGGNEKAVLKSMVRHLEKTDPNFKFRTLKNDATGRIEKDYEHLLQDSERKRYIHTFMDTYNNPQIKKNGFTKEGYPREYRYSIYDNPEHNNYVYDLISNSETGKTLTKIAREGKHGQESISKIMDLVPPNSQVSEVGNIASQTEILPPHNANFNKNITSLQTNVNPFEKRSFVEALANRDKARIMRNGVLSGASDLSERARILQDNLVRRKNGWFDADFEKLIKTPEMAKAEVSYAQFMAKNGGKTLAPEKVNSFYQNHPIAKDIIAEMREVDPRAFDNIAPGSLAEFDMLKKILREEAGNKIKVGASKSGALKRAENSLKELMDTEFPGFKDINTKYAEAASAQNVFESKLNQGLTSVGGGTANVTPFWSGISSPLTAAGVVGGFFNPMSLAVTGAGLAGKALMRNSRRAAARRLADGIVRTPINVDINPVLTNGLSAPALRAASDYQNK